VEIKGEAWNQIQIGQLRINSFSNSR